MLCETNKKFVEKFSLIFERGQLSLTENKESPSPYFTKKHEISRALALRKHELLKFMVKFRSLGRTFEKDQNYGVVP
jgi:hypothetical protein